MGFGQEFPPCFSTHTTAAAPGAESNQIENAKKFGLLELTLEESRCGAFATVSRVLALELLTTRSRAGSRLPLFCPLSPSPLCSPRPGSHPRTKRAIRRGILEETSLAVLSGEFEADWLPWS